MSNISKIKIGTTTYSLSTTCSVAFSYSSSTPTIWTATANGVSLEDGLHITGKAPVAAKLAQIKLNNGGAHYVVDYKGEVITSTIARNSVVMLKYNGSISHGGISGVWQIDSNYYEQHTAISTADINTICSQVILNSEDVDL